MGQVVTERGEVFQSRREGKRRDLMEGRTWGENPAKKEKYSRTAENKRDRVGNHRDKESRTLGLLTRLDEGGENATEQG